MKSFLLKLHRYIGLALAPFMVIILVTGMILAFKPILAPSISQQPVAENAAQLVQAVERLNNNNIRINSLELDQDGERFWITGGGVRSQSAYALSDGSFIGTGGMSNDFFQTVKSLHKSFLLDAETLVEWLSYLMAAVIVIGFFILMKPRFRKTLMSWHNALGVWLLPLWLVLPVTGVLMTNMIGGPDVEQFSQNSATIPVMVEHLQETGQLEQLVSITSLKGGRYMMVNLMSDAGLETVQIDADTLVASPVELNTYIPKVLHEGTWAGAFSGWLNFLVAGALLFFTCSGVYSWVVRSQRERNERLAVPVTGGANEVLVAYATQTGTAQGLAKDTVEYLQRHDVKAKISPLASVTAQSMAQFKATLIIASTTGKGDMPEGAKRFINGLLAAANLDATQINYSILALGDSSYAQFCAAGIKLEQSLQKIGAQATQPLVKADADPIPAWSEWIQGVAKSLGFTPSAEVELPRSNDTLVKAKLIERKRLDNPEFSRNEVQMLLFELPNDIDFRGGDLFLVTPPGEQQSRPYSVGSDVLEGNILRLTVSLHQFKDADGLVRNGACSEYLCHDLEVGQTIDAVVRTHSSFHVPEDNQPMILAGTGCGIAPLVGFLPRLAKDRRYTWLFFGNGHEQGDNLYAEEWDKAQQDGVISRIDRVFDNQQRGYIQHQMITHGEEIFQLLQQQGARIFLCGRANTVGRGVEEALLSIAQTHGGMSEEQAQNWLTRLREEERIREDLFG